MQYKRNEGMYTSTETAIQNVLTGLLGGPSFASGCGYLAFPNYYFRTRQAADHTVQQPNPRKFMPDPASLMAKQRRTAIFSEF